MLSFIIIKQKNYYSGVSKEIRKVCLNAATKYLLASLINLKKLVNLWRILLSKIVIILIYKNEIIKY